MARSAPDKALPIHPPLILTLAFSAWLAVVLLTVAAGICASRLYRRPSPKSKSSRGAPAPPSLRGSDSIAVAAAEAGAAVVASALPTTSPPPAPPNDDGSLVVVMGKARPRRKLSASLSVGMLREGLGMSRAEKKERRPAPEEESVWKKTIIMGERCRTPAGEDDDMVVYDDKGVRQKIFHHKTPRSLPVSRRNSFAEINLPSSDLLESFCN